MRSTRLALPLLLTGCAVVPALRASEPAQAVAGDPASAAMDQDGVRLTATPDDWRGWPQDLADHLTPVAVRVENRSGRPLELGPEDFTLVLPDGRRLQPLSTAETRSGLRPYAAGWASVYYPWAPGRFEPTPIPGWWGPWAGPVEVRPVERTTLGDGERRSLLIFFPVPANRLERLAIELRPGGAEAGPGAGLRLAFARSPPAPR